jgi:hypothetical protein
MPGQWLGRPPSLPAQLAAPGCGACPRAAHGIPSGARTRTSRVLLTSSSWLGAELARVQSTTVGIELHTPTRIHSPEQQGDVALKLHVASVYF